MTRRGAHERLRRSTLREKRVNRKLEKARRKGRQPENEDDLRQELLALQVNSPIAQRGVETILQNELEQWRAKQFGEKLKKSPLPGASARKNVAVVGKDVSQRSLDKFSSARGGDADDALSPNVQRVCATTISVLRFQESPVSLQLMKMHSNKQHAQVTALLRTVSTAERSESGHCLHKLTARFFFVFFFLVLQRNSRALCKRVATRKPVCRRPFSATCRWCRPAICPPAAVSAASAALGCRAMWCRPAASTFTLPAFKFVRPRLRR